MVNEPDIVLVKLLEHLIDLFLALMVWSQEYETRLVNIAAIAAPYHLVASM